MGGLFIERKLAKGVACWTLMWLDGRVLAYCARDCGLQIGTEKKKIIKPVAVAGRWHYIQWESIK